MSADVELLRIGELAKKVGVARSTIYEHVKLGYRLKYPILRKTTLEHYLAWAETQEPAPPKKNLLLEKEMAIQRAIMRGEDVRKARSRC